MQFKKYYHTAKKKIQSCLFSRKMIPSFAPEICQSSSGTLKNDTCLHRFRREIKTCNNSQNI